MTTKATKRLYELIGSLEDDNAFEGDSQAIRDKHNFIQGWNADVREAIQKLLAASYLAKHADYADFVIDKTATFTITFTQTQAFHTCKNVNTDQYQWHPDVIEYNKDRVEVNFATLAGFQGDIKTQILLERHGIKCEPSKAALLACAFNKKAWMQFLISRTNLDMNEMYALSHDYQAGTTRLTESYHLNLLSLAVANFYQDFATMLLANKADSRAAYTILQNRFFLNEQDEQSIRIKSQWQELEKAATHQITVHSASAVSLIVIRNDGPLHRAPLQNEPEKLVKSHITTPTMQ